MQRLGYPISLAGTVGALMLPNDILDIVTMVAKNWPVMQALLPWLGVMMAVGFGAWFFMMLSIDVPRFVRRKIREKRDYWCTVMRRVADDIQAASKEGRLIDPKISGECHVDIDDLRKKGLFPLVDVGITNSANGMDDREETAKALYRVIPVLDRHGFRTARNRVDRINRYWGADPKWPIFL